MEPELVISRLVPICDFCSSKEIVIAYLIEDFSLPEFGWGSKGGFAACAECRDLVEAGKRYELATRSIRTFTKEFGALMSEDFARYFIDRLHTEFWKRLRPRAS